jgi:hypothetical protein
MIFRFLTKTVTPIAIGSVLVGWASFGGTPDAKSHKAHMASPTQHLAPPKRAGGFAVGKTVHLSHPTTIKTKTIALGETERR